MFQRSKGLTHVTEFAQRRVELVRLRLASRAILRRTPAADPEIQEDEDEGRDKQGEGRYHVLG
jgi:hypothetical protein